MLKALGIRLRQGIHALGFGAPVNSGAGSDRSAPSMEVRSELPPAPPPKVKPGAKTFPGWMRSTRTSDSALPKTDRRITETDITTYRSGNTTSRIIRDFAAANPDLAAAVFAYARVGITNEYTAVAKNLDGTFSPEGTALVQQIIQRMDLLPDYSEGFSGAWSLRSIAEAFAKELLFEGALAGELVLDKARLPSRIQPISASNITFKPGKDNKLVPIQTVSGEEIVLDIPTFFYVSLDQNLLDAYPASMLEPALKAVVFAENFVADLQRVAKRAVHPRLYIKIAEEAIKKSAPPEAQHDKEAYNTYLNQVLSDIESQINGLEPEDALVMYDSLEPDYLNNGNISIGDEWKTLQDIVNAKLAAGAKTLPAILGHGVGSQNIASTEVMLFLKNASGSVQAKLNEIFSRMFTLAVRLFGLDVIVEFRYADIDLRPEAELEAFRQTRQSRVLELLSIGMLTDDEACLKLTGKLPPQGYAPLSGTMFKVAQGSSNPNPTGQTNNGSALNQNLNSDAPSQGRGQNNKTDPQKTRAEVLEFQTR